MNIGLDFDNTIVAYDDLLFELARERELIPADVAVSKTAIRDYLRRIGQEPLWTVLQGLAYGEQIGRARMFSGVLEFVSASRNAGVPLAIVSHRTRRPYLGADIDLHAAARGWLQQQGLGDVEAYFELTKEAKLARIAALGCTHFIDDLPEFLSLPGFPVATRKILFDPLSMYLSEADVLRFGNWPEIGRMVLCQSMAA